MTLNLTDFLAIVSIILSFVALIVTIVGFFASLSFYKSGVKLQDNASKALAKIEEKTTSISQQVSGIFDKAFDAALSKGGQINQDFADINEQIQKASQEILDKTTNELHSIGADEKDQLMKFVSEQLKTITDQVIVTQENATEIVSTPENEVQPISQFQSKILDTLRSSGTSLTINEISDKIGISVPVIEKAIFRLIAKHLILSENGKYQINEYKQREDLSLIDKAFKSAANGQNQVLLAKLGTHLQKINPSFNARAYGYNNLSEYLRDQEGYSLIDNYINGYNHYIVVKK